MIEQGQTFSRDITVDVARTIDFMGPDLRVYATPSMVLDVEMACRDMLLAALDKGQDSVGARVVIDHLGPAYIGDQIAIRATLKLIEGRRVTFDATVTRQGKVIGSMQHVRAIVSVADLKARLAKK